MKFVADGKTYALEFKRSKGHVVMGDGYVDRAKNLFTTAIVREVQEGEKDTEKWPIAYEASVGCHPLDRYTPEGGRWASLKKLCKQVTIPEGIKAGVWAAFLGRLDHTSTKHMSPKQLRRQIADLKLQLEAANAEVKVWKDRYGSLNQSLNEGDM